LAVDAVLLIGEHGRYPFNEIGQHLYPRKEFFDQALAVMKRAGRYVPLFNDKHFSYRFDWAKEMCDTAVAHGMPIMAGSSVPLAQRVPPLDLPVDAEFEAALAVHSGDLESYDFHGLEVLQSFVERRRGGETGVANIEVLIGEAADRAGDEGRWPRELLDAALAVEEQAALRRQTWTSAEGLKIEQRTAPKKMKHVILITYRDGLRATVVAIGGTSNRWDFACKLKGESKPRSTAFYNGSWGNRGLFKALSHAIQRLFIERQEPYPHQRTLLTGGMTEAAVKSHAAGRPLDTPHLDVKYQAVDFARFRENGDTWRKLTVDIPQPSVFAPGDAKLTAGS
jgi:hypothetical protein